MKKITSEAIIDFLEEIFCRLGYPKYVTADNGKQFVSELFKKYCENNNIELKTITNLRLAASQWRSRKYE